MLEEKELWQKYGLEMQLNGLGLHIGTQLSRSQGDWILSLVFNEELTD